MANKKVVLEGTLTANREQDIQTAFGLIHVKKGQRVPGVRITMDDPEVDGKRFWGTFSAVTDRKGRYRIVMFEPEN